MTTPALARLETTNRVPKRAQYETFEVSVELDGVLVRNGSYADPEPHEYRVTVTNGLPTDRECPANGRTMARANIVSPSLFDDCF